MKILSIDTTSEVCGVAILEDEKLILDNSVSNGFTHSENLMPLVKNALDKVGLKINEIDLISCCVGPGSFTGIRIGVASINAIAEVNNIPIVEVTSLESLAKNIKEEFQTKVSLIDARNKQCYCGIFDNEINLKEDYIADDINVLLEIIKNYSNICFVGNGAFMHKELILTKILDAKFEEENNQNAYSCGLIGFKKFKENKLINADKLLPNYLRKSQAERLKKD